MSGSETSGGERQWVYTLSVKGRYQRLHRGISAVLFAILLIIPWVSLDGEPLLRMDLPARRLHVLGMLFTPHDTIFLVLIGLFAAFSLFFFTSLYGRLWCGYACPQTVFLEELIRPIEEAIEGSRGKRMARDRGPWTWDRLWRKGLKWSAFAGISVFLSLSIGSFFLDPRILWSGGATAGTYGVFASVAALFFADFAWFREQFCNYVCPYARFQGALTDEMSQVIAYDVARGEPRGKAKVAVSGGSCIDCKKCVAVCPQGIDIREGFQLECINCARCADACSTVMGKLGHESLISYTTIAQTQGEQHRIIRPRTVGYATLLAGIAAAFIFLAMGQHTLDATVNRAPGSLYTLDEDGMVRNTFLLQVTSKRTGEASAVTVTLEGLPGAELVVPPMSLLGGGVQTVPLVVRASPENIPARTTPIDLTITIGEDAIELHTTFKSNSELEG